MNSQQQSKLTFVQNLYYYFALSILGAMFCIAIYWQIQTEHVVFEVNTKQVFLNKDKKDFVADVNFCTSKQQKLKINRYYQNTKTSIVYYVPEGTYQTAGTGCFKTQLNAYAGRLDPGHYTYHVTVSYDLNPLRSIEKEVAVIVLEIQ